MIILRMSLFLLTLDTIGIFCLVILVTDRIKLDVDPQRDDDASPMSTYRCMLRPT